MLSNHSNIYFFRILIDFLFVSLLFWIVAYFNIKQETDVFILKNIFVYLWNVLIWFSAGQNFGLYDEYRSRDFSFEIIALLKTIFTVSLANIIVLFFIRDKELSRLFIIFYSLFLLLILTVVKFIFRKALYEFRKSGKNIRTMLIVGAGELGRNFVETIEQNPHYGYKVIGFVDDKNKSFLNGKYLGKIGDLDKVLNENNVNNVIIALPNYAYDKIEEVVDICNRYTTRVKIIPDYFKVLSPKYNISMFGQFPVISVRGEKINEFHWRLVKRAFDTAFSIFVFITIFSWLWPLIAFAIKLDSKGPVFFKQERWGRDNRKFYAYKFRSMVVTSRDVDENGRYLQATKDDPRITRIGKILRRTNLDELPQFWNVLKGEMSIVGPRPHPEQLNIESKERVRYYMLRHLVKPGITGWAQVNGYRGETKDISKMQKRVDYDLWYIENWSFFLDIQIILKTISNMIKGDPNAY